MHHDCCYRTALKAAPDADASEGSSRRAGASFCGECGGPILRCAAFEECGGLVDTDGRCSVCVAPELILGSTRTTRAGGVVSLPFVIRNASSVGRPLVVSRLLVRENGGPWREEELPWERLDAGATAPATVTTSPLDREGSHRVEVAIVVHSRWRWREEVLAFSAGLELDVASGDSVTVQQTINVASEGMAGSGGTIYAPLRFDGGGPISAETLDARQLELVRASRLERELGLRGDDQGLVVPRGARAEWNGFAGGAAPLPGPIATRDGVLAVGRSRTALQGGDGDLRVLASGPDGAVDQELSLEISRRHFSLWIQNDRLMLRADSSRGGELAGAHIASGACAPLRDGDVFRPHGRARGAGVEVRFDAHHGVVHTVRFSAC